MLKNLKYHLLIICSFLLLGSALSFKSLPLKKEKDQNQINSFSNVKEHLKENGFIDNFWTSSYEEQIEYDYYLSVDDKKNNTKNGYNIEGYEYDSDCEHLSIKFNDGRTKTFQKSSNSEVAQNWDTALGSDPSANNGQGNGKLWEVQQQPYYLQTLIYFGLNQNNYSEIDFHSISYDRDGDPHYGGSITANATELRFNEM